MKKLGLDLHTLIGAGGLIGTFAVSSISLWAGAVAGTATAVYMILRACREYVILRREIRSPESKPDEID